jgi:hypothetical protein
MMEKKRGGRDKKIDGVIEGPDLLPDGTRVVRVEAKVEMGPEVIELSLEAAVQLYGGHCHVNFCRTTGSYPRMYYADHATCGAHVTCCQMLKAWVRIVR